MSSSSSSFYETSSAETQSSIIEASPPTEEGPKPDFWESLSNFHKRKREAEKTVHEETEDEGPLKLASASKIPVNKDGGETTHDGDKDPAAESLATTSAARFPSLFVQPKAAKVKLSASKKTWFKTRASARIAASRRASALATSGDKAKKPEIIIID